MTEPIIPQNAVNNNQNFAGSATSSPVRQYGPYNRISETLRQDKRKRGYDAQGNKVAIIRDGGLRIHAALYRICAKNRVASAVISKDILAEASDLAPSTFPREYRAVVRRGAILEHKDHRGVLHRICVDPDFPKFAQAEKRRLEAADEAARADKRAKAEHRRQRAARVNYADQGQGQVQTEKPIPPPVDTPPAEPAETAPVAPVEQGQGCSDSETRLIVFSGKIARFFGQGCPSPPSECHGSPIMYSTTETITTTTPTLSMSLGVVGEPRARKSAAQPVVVVANSTGDEQGRDAGEKVKADVVAFDPMVLDPFSEEPTPKPYPSSAGPATTSETNVPPPVERVTEPPVEAAKKVVLKFAPPTVDEVALSTVIGNIADTFGEYGIQVRHVETMIGDLLVGVSTPHIVKRMIEALKSYKEAEDDPTVEIGKPWGYFRGTIKNVHKDMAKVEASEPKISYVDTRITPEFSDDQKAAVDSHIEGLDAESKMKLLADTAALMMPDLRDSKPLVKRNSRKLVAERLGIPVSVLWKATPEQLAAAMPAVSHKKLERYMKDGANKPAAKLPLKPDGDAQHQAKEAFASSPLKAKFQRQAEAEFAANYPGIIFRAALIDQRAENLFAQAQVSDRPPEI